MEGREVHYLIRDQDDGPSTLDLLQAWGLPLRPPLWVRMKSVWRALRSSVSVFAWRHRPTIHHPADPRRKGALLGEASCAANDPVRRCCFEP